MSMESPAYRDVLASLRERFGADEDILTINQVCQYLHCDRRTLLRDKSLQFNKRGRSYVIHVMKFARWLS